MLFNISLILYYTETLRLPCVKWAYILDPNSYIDSVYVHEIISRTPWSHKVYS